MERSRFTEAQIIGILNEQEARIPSPIFAIGRRAPMIQLWSLTLGIKIWAHHSRTRSLLPADQRTSLVRQHALETGAKIHWSGTPAGRPS